MRPWQIAVLIICSGTIGAADLPSVTAGTTVRPPLLGYVRLAPGEIRPITGFVGANVVQYPVPAGMAAFPAPSQEYALVRSGEPPAVGVARLDASGFGPVEPIPGALVPLDRAIFSSSGRSAILHAISERRLQVIAGLPDQPRMERDLDLSAFPGTFITAAVTDDARIVLAAFSSGETARLEEIRTGTASRTLLELPSISAVRYLPGSSVVLIADALSSRIVSLGEDSSEPVVLAGAGEGVSGPADIETSSDGRLVFVANSTAGLVVIDRETRQTQVLACGFPPFSFQRLLGSALAVVARDGASVAVLDTDAAEPWVAYAPKVRD